ncbi:MAG: helix-turn-helix domain-containing protein [Asticcacaulis sp.]
MAEKFTPPSSNEPPKLAYRIDEAVKATGLGRSFLYEHIASGELRSVKIGKRRLILHNDLVQFLSGAAPVELDKEAVGSTRKPEPKPKSGKQTNVKVPGQLEFPWRR